LPSLGCGVILAQFGFRWMTSDERMTYEKVRWRKNVAYACPGLGGGYV
jgi:hypothetical protein